MVKLYLFYKILQSNEVGGSYHMEKEGLNRAMEFITQHNLSIEILVTDRHRQINKWLRESHPQIKHYFDVWHVAKGMCKFLKTSIKHHVLYLIRL